MCVLGICSCSNDVGHQMNGQWLLKTINENGTISQVDTVFYSFQRGSIFSFTTFLPETNQEETTVSYGYVTLPSEKEMFIAMDTSRYSPNYFKNISPYFLQLSGWDNYYQLFRIEFINNDNMILSIKGKIYTFKKH